MYQPLFNPAYAEHAGEGACWEWTLVSRDITFLNVKYVKGMLTLKYIYWPQYRIRSDTFQLSVSEAHAWI